MKCLFRLQLVFLLLRTPFLHSQNLVPNGSFETIISCPSAHGESYLATPWSQPANTLLSSPDLFNVCNTNGFGVPNNTYGYQMAHSGISYAGIYCYGEEWREYLQIQLSTSLSPGVVYRAEIYVSPSETMGLGVDRIGIHFSTGPVSGTGLSWLLPYQPQIMNQTNFVISDTTNWVLVSGLYQAIGGENYITIGNFFNDANTNTDTLAPTFEKRGYLKIDDVSLSIANQAEVFEFLAEEQVSIYPNPFSDQLNITCKGLTNVEFFLYDFSSKIILHETIVNKTSLRIGSLENGVYYYKLKNADGIVRYGKVFKN